MGNVEYWEDWPRSNGPAVALERIRTVLDMVAGPRPDPDALLEIARELEAAAADLRTWAAATSAA